MRTQAHALALPLGQVAPEALWEVQRERPRTRALIPRLTSIWASFLVYTLLEEAHFFLVYVFGNALFCDFAILQHWHWYLRT